MPGCDDANANSCDLHESRARYEVNHHQDGKDAADHATYDDPSPEDQTRISPEGFNCVFDCRSAKMDQVSATTYETPAYCSQVNENCCWEIPEVRFSNYSFINECNFDNLSTKDFKYLESMGCLHLPMKPMRDEFVQQYFTHIHPLLPILNEGDFWEAYVDQPLGNGPGSTEGQLPLVIFQAMLFVCCTFVSSSTLRALGFANIRDARESLYHRSKLLFDCGIDSCPLTLSRAGLLLSFWSPTSTQACLKPDVMWLTTAIHHAKLVQAHQYTAILSRAAGLTLGESVIESRRANQLKRLWWCCVIRDSTLGLEHRQPAQINRAHFGFDMNPGLCRTDLRDEELRSQVFSPTNKRHLADVLHLQIKFCVLLKDVLLLADSFYNVSSATLEQNIVRLRRIQAMKRAMRMWHSYAKSWISATSLDPTGDNSSFSRDQLGKSDSQPFRFANTLLIQYQ